MADFLPFSQSRLSNQYFLYIFPNFFIAKLAASYSYFSLAILDLGRQIEESKFPRAIYKCSFTFISLLEKFGSRKK